MNYDPRYQQQYQYQQQQYPMAPVYAAPINVWRCPFCGYQGHAIADTKISAAGWVVFVLLLLFCFPLFWIGLLIKDTVTRCPQCLKGG